MLYPGLLTLVCRAWQRALNVRLPADISISKAVLTERDRFHARHSATSRRYRYSILTDPRPSVFLAPLTWHFYQRPLDVDAMNRAAATLVSSEARDFSAFRKAGAPAAHTRIQVFDISVCHAMHQSHLVELEVCANWYVYGMMRLLVAALVQVGTHALTIEEFIRIAESGNRASIKHAAPASGLCLMQVGYPENVDPFGCPFDDRSSRVPLGLSDHQTVKPCTHQRDAETKNMNRRANGYT